MFKAKNNILPRNIPKLFSNCEGGYNLRGNFNFNVHSVRTTKKTFYNSICVIRLWNSLNAEIKQSPT